MSRNSMFVHGQSLCVYSLRLLLSQIQKKKKYNYKEEFYKFMLLLPVCYTYFQPTLSKTSSANQMKGSKYKKKVKRDRSFLQIHCKKEEAVIVEHKTREL